MQLHHQLRRHQQGSPGTWLVESGHCLGHHFPLGFRQMHSQMIHKGAFSEPPNSQAVASQVLSLLHFPPETDTQARATLCTAWLPHWLLSLFHLPPTQTLRRHMSEHCLGHHFPLGFRQMHSQMIHKGAFSEPPNSQAVASQVLSLLHFPPETDTQARATLCTGFLAASQELPHTSAVMKRFADFLVTPLWCCLSTRSVINIVN